MTIDDRWLPVDEVSTLCRVYPRVEARLDFKQSSNDSRDIISDQLIQNFTFSITILLLRIANCFRPSVINLLVYNNIEPNSSQSYIHRRTRLYPRV